MELKIEAEKLSF